MVFIEEKMTKDFSNASFKKFKGLNSQTPKIIRNLMKNQFLKANFKEIVELNKLILPETLILKGS